MRQPSATVIVALVTACLGCGRVTETAPLIPLNGSADKQSLAPEKPVAAEPPPAVERQGRWLADVKPLSLNQMTELADRIFVGTVREVQPKTVTLTENDQSVEAAVRDVVISIDEGIKGTKTGDELTIRQLVSASAPLRPGERIVWFLPEPSHLGLSQPVGVFSGDFRIQQSEQGPVAQNLRGNAGLWSGAVWDEGFNRNRVLLSARDRKLSQSSVQMIESAASTDPDSRGIPLDLLLLLTRSVSKQ